MSPADEIPQVWSASKAPQLQNGWGFVCRLHDHTVYGFGRVPSYVLASLVLLRSKLSPLVVAFIDNRAGLAALVKGFGRDPCINNLIGLAWRLINYYGWQIHFNWVSSEHNIADRVSRQDGSDMQFIPAECTAFQLTPLFQILCRAAEDTEYAHGAALADLLAQQPEASYALPDWR